MLLYVAFHDCTVGIPLTFRTDRNLFNVHKLQLQTKTTFADDRFAWREERNNALNRFEEQRIDMAKVCLAARKDCYHSVSSTSTIHTCDMWMDLFISYQPVQTQMKPLLRFVVSTTHSIIVCVCVGGRGEA